MVFTNYIHSYMSMDIYRIRKFKKIHDRRLNSPNRTTSTIGGIVALFKNTGSAIREGQWFFIQQK
jgi:hypothetical protein